jgi:hypothetical protein
MIKPLEVSADVLSVLEDDRLWTDRYEPTTEVNAFSRLFLSYMTRILGRPGGTS